MGLLTACFVPSGGFLYTMIVPGEGFCSLQIVSRGFVPGGTVLDEIDTCIMSKETLLCTSVNDCLQPFLSIDEILCCLTFLCFFLLAFVSSLKIRYDNDFQTPCHIKPASSKWALILGKFCFWSSHRSLTFLSCLTDP